MGSRNFGILIFVFCCQSTTGSFFRDRSTTLGTLMGVSLADEEEREDHHHSGQDAVEEGTGSGTPCAPVHEEEGEGRRWRRRWRRRHWRGAAAGWWRLCRDDVRVPTSLGHFLGMERQLSGAGLLCGDDGRAGERDAGAAETGRWKLRRPAPAHGTSSSLARLPVLLTAICSGGAA